MSSKKFFCIVLAVLIASLAVSCKKDKVKESDEEKLVAISVYPEEIDLSVKEKFQLYVSSEPENLYLDVTWSSNKSNITVSETGVVNAGLFEGDAVITARCGDKEAHCNVRVTVPVQMLSFGEYTSISMAVGEILEDMQAYYYPLTATDRNNIVLNNSDPSVAELTLDERIPGKFSVKAKSLGTTTITATCGGKEAELFIFVDEVKATKTTISPSSVNLKCGEFKELYASVDPEGTTNREVSWYSLTPEIVSVKKGTSNYATVRALREGNGVIGAYCGDAYSFCNVTVSGLPDGAVDMGLSVYWAESNVGASSPFEAGNYYAWGEVTPKSTYDWEHYKYFDGGIGAYGDRYHFSRYNDEDGKTSFSGYDYADDAAYQTLGGQWRVPTLRQFNELLNNCEVVFEDGGVRFYSIVPGYVGQSLYFPLEGYKDGDSLVNETTSWHDSMGLPYVTYHQGFYWLSGLSSDKRNPYSRAKVVNLWLHSGADPFEWGYWDDGQHDLYELKPATPSVEVLGGYRFLGYTIRPVW